MSAHLQPGFLTLRPASVKYRLTESQVRKGGLSGRVYTTRYHAIVYYSEVDLAALARIWAEYRDSIRSMYPLLIACQRWRISTQRAESMMRRGALCISRIVDPSGNVHQMVSAEELQRMAGLLREETGEDADTSVETGAVGVMTAYAAEAWQTRYSPTELAHIQRMIARHRAEMRRQGYDPDKSFLTFSDDYDPEYFTRGRHQQ